MAQKEHVSQHSIAVCTVLALGAARLQHVTTTVSCCLEVYSELDGKGKAASMHA